MDHRDNYHKDSSITGRWAGSSGVREGMPVYSADCVALGTVKQIREEDFLLDRLVARDIYVPFDSIQDNDGNHVILITPAIQIDGQGWSGVDVSGTSV